MMQDTNASERIDMDLGTGDRFQMATDAGSNPPRMQGAYFFQPAGRLVRTAFRWKALEGWTSCLRNHAKRQNASYYAWPLLPLQGDMPLL